MLWLMGHSATPMGRSLRHIVHRLRASLRYRWEMVHRYVNFRWLVYVRSQTATISSKSALIFSPHQDDETLGCGGIIASKRKRGVAVWVVFLTDGSACFREPCPLNAQEIAQMRRQEAIAALHILGVDASHIFFLEQPDQGLGDLAPQAHQQVVAQIQHILQQTKPAEVFVPHRHDNHPDHIATCALVTEALRQSKLSVEQWQYLVWGLWYPHWLKQVTKEEFDRLHRVPIHPVWREKQQAMRAYRSQYLPIAPATSPVLPQGFIRHFSSAYEVVVRVE